MRTPNVLIGTADVILIGGSTRTALSNVIVAEPLRRLNQYMTTGDADTYLTIDSRYPSASLSESRPAHPDRRR